MQSKFISTYSFPPFTLQVETIQKISGILIILLQMLVQLFVTNIIIGLPFNSNNYAQYKRV